MSKTEDFREELQAQIQRAQRQGRPHIEINSGELHRTLGGYPPKAGTANMIPSCCAVMWAEHDKGKAKVVFQTASGRSASLTIRYRLPRPST